MTRQLKALFAYLLQIEVGNATATATATITVSLPAVLLFAEPPAAPFLPPHPGTLLFVRSENLQFLAQRKRMLVVAAAAAGCA